MSKRYPFNGYETMASGYTNGLYLPTKPLSEWDIDECRRALCKHANGDVMRCLECENKCRYGRRIETLLAPVEAVEDQANEQPAEQPAEKKNMRGVKGAEMKKRAAEIKYLRIIASGDPKAYLEAHGMEIRNNMSRLRIAYKDVTPEEARKRLAEMGADVEETQGMPVNATETPAEQPAQAQPDESTEEHETPTIPVETVETESPEPVKPAGAKLQIHTLDGEWFRYTRRSGDAVGITPNMACFARASDIDAICAEIKAAFEMMGGIKE